MWEYKSNEIILKVSLIPTIKPSSYQYCSSASTAMHYARIVILILVFCRNEIIAYSFFRFIPQLWFLVKNSHNYIWTCVFIFFGTIFYRVCCFLLPVLSYRLLKESEQFHFQKSKLANLVEHSLFVLVIVWLIWLQEFHY